MICMNVCTALYYGTCISSLTLMKRNVHTYVHVHIRTYSRLCPGVHGKLLVHDRDVYEKSHLRHQSNDLVLL